MYSIKTKVMAEAKFDSVLSKAVDTMYPNIDLRESFEQSILTCKKARIRLRGRSNVLSEINVYVSENEFKESISSLDDIDKKNAWEYRAHELRETLLNNILLNKKKLSYLIRETLKNILRAIIESSNNSITLSQAIHIAPINATKYKRKDGSEHPITQWGVDELRLQLISELCEANLLDMTISNKIHMITIPKKLGELIKAEWTEMFTLSRVINYKTILLEPAGVTEKQMISQASWWYKTPILSKDQVEFIETMHSTKWEFVEGAEHTVEDEFKRHLKVNKLPEWAVSRVEEFKSQIMASRANGGHYIRGKFDSALRWYWQAEIGHNQSSEFLRNLVKPVGMHNIVKYDMTNNVVQMYAVSLKDKSLAKYVNLVDPIIAKEDLRLQIANAMNKVLNINTFNRDNIKPLFMVWAYNAGKNRLLDGVYTEKRNIFTGELVRTLKVEGLRSIAKGCSDDAIWNAWISILHTLVPSIVELKRVFSQIVKGNQFHEVSWVLPDGAIAQYASVETESKELKWITSTGHSHQHTHYRKQLALGSKDAGLLPRMIHSIDAYLMRQLVIRAKRKGIIVVPNHDSFMFDAKHTDTIFSMVRELLIEIMEDKVLYNIVKTFNVSKVKETGEYLEREILTKEDIMASYPMKLEA